MMQDHGPIAWMARNPVAANLLMIVLLVGGLLAASQMKREVFPDFTLPEVSVAVTCVGTTPEVMERSVVSAIEEAVQGIDGIKEVTSVSSEGAATITIAGLEDADPNTLLQDVKAAVDRITTLPEEAEKPKIQLLSPKALVLEAILTGSKDATALRYWGENIKDAMTQSPQITQCDLTGVRDHEIHVEVSQDTLRRYGLTISDISSAITRSSLEQGGGSIKTSGGDIMIRMNQRRNYAADFASVAVTAGTDGTRLKLGDIARITDTFDDTKTWATWNGEDSVLINVYRIGKQTPEAVSKAARQVIDEMNKTMPPGLKLDVVHDLAEVYVARQELLVKNAFQGIVLVFLCLALFLRPSLAFWVSLGIPVSVLGAFIFFPAVGLTMNMITMFAFIVTLGIVVDDAIVVSENVASHQERGDARIAASIAGTQEVAVPVIFSVITNMVSFVPILFVPGFMGRVWSVLPWVVILVFSCSLTESLFVLPSHLAHESKPRTNPGVLMRLWMRFEAAQQRCSAHIKAFAAGPFLRFEYLVVDNRYLVLACATALMLAMGAFAGAGWLGFDLAPRVEQTRAFVSATVPAGSSKAVIDEVSRQLVASAKKTAKDLESKEGRNICSGIFLRVKDSAIQVGAYVGESGTRKTSTEEFTDLWRRNTPVIPDAETLLFQSDLGGPGAGKGLTVRLSHRDKDTLDRAAKDLAERLSHYTECSDIDSGLTHTKRLFDMKITPLGEQLGLTSRSVSTQVRNAFSGQEAQRQQRDRDEVIVRVMLPEEDREKLSTFENLVLRTPSGKEVLLRDAVTISDTHADSTISHTNGMRTATVSANITPPSAVQLMMNEVEKKLLPQLMSQYPGLTWSWGGRQTDIMDSFNTMMVGLVVALFAVYALLAVPFRSYLQPLIIMVAIPFGIIGAFIGHVIMGYSLSLISVFGIVALSGIVVNDSLVLIDTTNNRLAQGAGPREAIATAASQRFRAIVLTTITTFAGLMPICLETSRQASVMIPVAISLGFGVLFATFVTLLIVPALFMALDDFHGMVH